MKLYFAPLEGICTSTFRKLYEKNFGGCDGYYAPFIVPASNEKFTKKKLRELLPENNIGINLTPQVLCNAPEPLTDFAKELSDIGYTEVNINLGCPSGTVVGKNRGSGMLKDLENLDRFLDDVFSKTPINISIKSRIGFNEDVTEELIKIYNKYPIKLLTLHPRTRADLYDGIPRYDSFEVAYKLSKNLLCYNGNIFTKDDYTNICERFPNIEAVMIGRGAIKNPVIFKEIRGGKPLTSSDLLLFSNELIKSYLELYKSDKFTLQKLKEVWMYMVLNYPNNKKLLKAIKKSTKLCDLENAIKGIFYYPA